MYNVDRKQQDICLRGGVKVPTGGIVRERLYGVAGIGAIPIPTVTVWMREGVYGISAMLLFDACTLEDNSKVYFTEKRYFL